MLLGGGGGFLITGTKGDTYKSFEMSDRPRFVLLWAVVS